MRVEPFIIARRYTYRDPNAAWERLAALEAAEGGPKGAERALGHGGGELLGELRGKTGWFASPASKAERDSAERCAAAVGGGLVRLREAEERAGQGYVAGVKVQRARDAVQVPGLSPAAWAAVRAVERAGDTAVERAAKANANPVWVSLMARQDRMVAEAWAREVEGRPGVAAELRAVTEAAGKLLGEDGVRELARSARTTQGGPEQREGLAGIGRALAAADRGRTRRRRSGRARSSASGSGCGRGVGWGFEGPHL